METTTTTAQNPTKVATKWALILVVTAIVLTYAIQFANLDPNSPIKYLTYIPFIAFLILAQKEYKDQLGGYISFGDAFSTGFRYAVFSGLMMAVFIYLYLAILSPEVFDKALEVSRASMADKMPADQVDKSMDIAKKWGPLFGAFGVAIAYAIFGAIVSLIGAAIFKKERSPYDVANDAIDPAETTV